jgi:hypothetical protein
MKVVSTKQLASAIGRTPQRVYQLRRDGVIGELTDVNGRRIRNSLSLWDSVRDFAQFKTLSRSGRPSVTESAGLQNMFDF